MLKKLTFLTFLLINCFLNFSLLASEINMKEGLWKITTQIDAPGMKIPPMSSIYCLTKKNAVPYKRESNSHCNLKHYEVVGNTVIWKIECKENSGITVSTGKTTYYGDTFEGIVKVKSSHGEMTIHQKGKWIGKCK